MTSAYIICHGYICRTWNQSWVFALLTRPYCFPRIPTTRVALNGPLQGQDGKSFLRVDSTIWQSIVLVASNLGREWSSNPCLHSHLTTVSCLFHPIQQVSDRRIHAFTVVSPPYRACSIPSSKWVVVESMRSQPSHHRIVLVPSHLACESSSKPCHHSRLTIISCLSRPI